jgi:VIT1/CCC1 family predicted Fe2+/Mn2+ transporter
LEQYKLVKIDKSMAIKNGLASLISFLVCGFIPAIPYMISKGALGEWKNWDKHWIIVLSIGGI